MKLSVKTQCVPLATFNFRVILCWAVELNATIHLVIGAEKLKYCTDKQYTEKLIIHG